jgi:predicted SAM-dependent methyltransferase
MRRYYYRLRRVFQRRKRRKDLARLIHQSEELNIIIGAGSSTYAGWISTDVDTLDITSEADWQHYFQPGTINHLLSEHVFEHLSEQQCKTTFRLCFKYLTAGGKLRVAVPDGYRRDKVYASAVRPPQDGHLMLFTVDNLTAMLQEAGFQVTPLEYFDAADCFHAVEWDIADGKINRSAKFDKREKFKRDNVHYTSLIVDAVKPSFAG